MQLFLKEELSIENIHFWYACERYRHLTTFAERKVAAKKIAERHISAECPYPVNISSFIRQSVLENLDNAEPDLFERSHDHIYELMKLDSFVRFKSSDRYKECFMAEISGVPLPGDTT